MKWTEEQWERADRLHDEIRDRQWEAVYDEFAAKTKARADYVAALIAEESAKTGIDRKSIFRPNRNDYSEFGNAARRARTAIWRKMISDGWSPDAIGKAFGCCGKNVRQFLRENDKQTTP